ncbi:MAG TPA: hypothetical protein GX699_02675 [Firmicutes bacterium]|nr:hypothetical protein [Bacillota bacterium]
MCACKVSFPHFGNYHAPLYVLFTVGFEVEYIVPPPVTQRTLTIGSHHSPEFVCAPFKYTLGNFIETIAAGADTLIQTTGICRLAYYGELQEQILADLGYEVNFINLAGMKKLNPLEIYNRLKQVNPKASLRKIAATLPMVLKMVEYMDETEDYIRKNVGFACREGLFEKTHAEFLATLMTVRNRKELDQVYRDFRRRFRSIEVAKPENPLRVGIVGEFYTIMMPFSNHFLEKELANMGIVVDRWLNISNTLLHPPRKIREKVSPYTRYPMGITCSATISRALELAQKGYDGIIHLKSFGCTPEVDAMPVLQNISKDYQIPILFFSFDTQTSETGFKTRLEAFYDMLLMKKKREAIASGNSRCREAGDYACNYF